MRKHLRQKSAALEPALIIILSFRGEATSVFPSHLPYTSLLTYDKLQEM